MLRRNAALLAASAMAAALSLISAPGAAAQPFSPQTFLLADSPFSAPGDVLEGSPLRRQSPGRLLTRESGGRLLLGGTGREAVRTVEDGRHVGDLWGRSRFAYTLLSAGRIRLEAYAGNDWQSGILEERGERTLADLDSQESSARLTLPLGTGEVFLGWDQLRLRVAGTSDLLYQLIPLFSSSPAAFWEQRRREQTLGLRFPLAAALLEASISRLDAPGTLNLEEGGIRVSLPTGTRGVAWRALAIVPLARDRHRLGVWADLTTASQEGGVFRENGRRIGSGKTRQTGQSVGVFWEGKVASSDSLTLSYQRDLFEMDTRTFGILASALNYSRDIDRVGYHLRPRLEQSTYGLTYDRRYSGHRLRMAYQYLDAALRVDYGYSARIFLLTIEDPYTWQPPQARGHSLQTRYTLPVGRVGGKRVDLTLEAAQVIPLLPRSPKKKEPPALPGPRRRTRGGWTVGANLALYW